MPIMARLLNVGAAARLVGVDEVTLRRWDESGVFPARRTPNGYRTYTLGDVEELRTLRALRRPGRPRKKGKPPPLIPYEAKLASKRGQRKATESDRGCRVPTPAGHTEGKTESSVELN
jgi:hypothetical protein